VLDVRSAIDASAKHGEMTMTDGTVLGVTLDAGAIALPADVTAAAAEADLSTCTSCGKIDALPSGVQRVRISTTADSVNAGSLTLTRAGGAQRLRWDVAVLP
jgi:hypothetical protein